MERIMVRAAKTLLFSTLLAAAIPAEGAPGRTETTVIAFPRDGEASVGLSNGPLTLHSVTLENRPDADEVRSARSDRHDTKLLRWVFHVSNSGARDWHARVRVTVFDASGHRLGRNDRWAEVDARDFHDRITVFTRIPTIRYPTAHHVQIRADFYRH